MTILNVPSPHFQNEAEMNAYIILTSVKCVQTFQVFKNIPWNRLNHIFIWYFIWQRVFCPEYDRCLDYIWPGIIFIIIDYIS